MPSKVYIKVTPQLVGDPNVIATLERAGGINKREYNGDSVDNLYYIDYEGSIQCADTVFENTLRSEGYQEIFPEEYVHTIHLKKGDTSLLLPLKVPEGYEAVIDGKVVTEVEVQIRRKQWKPKKNEIYYFVTFGRYYQNVSSVVWTDCITDKMALDHHNVFKTKDEAEQFLEILKQHYWQAVEEYEQKL